MHLTYTTSQKIVNFFRRLYAFVRPVEGWKKRYLDYQAGRAVWPFPQIPEIGNIGPWPAEWTPYEVHVEDGKMHLLLLEHNSLISGKFGPREDSMNCARCGIAIVRSDTDMETNLDAPLCPWCRHVV